MRIGWGEPRCRSSDLWGTGTAGRFACFASWPWARCWRPAAVAATSCGRASAPLARRALWGRATAIRRPSSNSPSAAGRNRKMNRTGLLIALALAAAVGLLFGLYPRLDLDLVRPFFDPAAGGFWASFNPALNGVRDLSRLIVTPLVAPAALAMLGKLVLPRRPMLIPGRTAALMVATLALAPGL